LSLWLKPTFFYIMKILFTIIITTLAILGLFGTDIEIYIVGLIEYEEGIIITTMDVIDKLEYFRKYAVPKGLDEFSITRGLSESDGVVMGLFVFLPTRYLSKPNQIFKQEEVLNLAEESEAKLPLIFEKKLDKSRIKTLKHIDNDSGNIRHYPPAAQEWHNSVYAYNNSYIKTLPALDKIVMSLLKNYFNMFIPNKTLNIKRMSNRLRREKRSSLKKIFIGKGDIKHTNSKVKITFYTFNIEKVHLTRNYKLTYMTYYAPLKKVKGSLEVVPLKKYVGIDDEGNFNKDRERKIIITYNRPYTLKEFFEPAPNFQTHYYRMSDMYLIPKYKIITYYEIYYSIIEILMGKVSSYIDIFIKYYEHLNELLKSNLLNKDEELLIYINNIHKYSSYEYPKASRYKKLAQKLYKKKLTRYWYLLKFNIVKFERPFILNLKRIVENLYNKEVEFNVVNLKKIHLNSDIFTQVIALKLKNRENKLFRVLKSSLSRIKLPKVKTIIYKKSKPNRDEFLINKIRNTYINSMQYKETGEDSLNDLLLRHFPSANNLKIKTPRIVQRIPLTSYLKRHLKHFKLRGIRVEAKGRLTRRSTASRSVFKVVWKGGLKNVDSSFRGWSTVMLRGDAKSNVQYSIVNTNNSRGAFGVKCWVSSK